MGRLCTRIKTKNEYHNLNQSFILKNVPLLKASFSAFFLNMKMCFTREVLMSGQTIPRASWWKEKMDKLDNELQSPTKKSIFFNFKVISRDHMDLTLKKERAVKGNLLNIINFVTGLCIRIMRLKCILALKVILCCLLQLLCILFPVKSSLHFSPNLSLLVVIYKNLWNLYRKR